MQGIRWVQQLRHSLPDIIGLLWSMTWTSSTISPPRSTGSATLAIHYWIGTRSGQNYSIQIAESVAKERKRVAGSDQNRIVTAVDRLADTIRPRTMRTGNLRGLPRFRVGGCRIPYEVCKDEFIVAIIRVAHSRDANRFALLRAETRHQRCT